VDAFRCCVCGKKDAHRGFDGIGLECRLDSLAVFRGHPPKHHLKAVISDVTLSGKEVVKPLLGGPVFGEDDNSLIAPDPAGANMRIKPMDECLSLAIRPSCCMLGVLTNFLQEAG